MATDGLSLPQWAGPPVPRPDHQPAPKHQSVPPRTLDPIPTAWLAAIADPSIRAELENVYRTVADEIAARAPTCWTSGKCCSFEAYGHRLYVTGLEAAYTIANLHSIPAAPPLDRETLAAARSRGGCPFQLGKLCGIHTIKPLSCRIYFCQEGTREWQEDLTEHALRAVRELHDRRAIPYRYAEWRDLLDMFL